MITIIPMIARLPGPGSDLQGLEDDWVPSLADMDAAIAELQTKALEFDAETRDAELRVGGDVGSWRQAWTKFLADLADFADSIWFNRWQRRADILTYRARFNALAAWYRRLPGAGPTTTPTYDPTQTSPGGGGSTANSIAATVKWAAIGLVAVAGIVAVGQLVGLVKLGNLLPGEKTT